MPWFEQDDDSSSSSSSSGSGGSIAGSTAVTNHPEPTGISSPGCESRCTLPPPPQQQRQQQQQQQCVLEDVLEQWSLVSV
jgi:hypothetical protein